MATNYKTVNLNFFQLKPAARTKEQAESEFLELKSFILNIKDKKIYPIENPDYIIDLESNLIVNPEFFIGTLTKNQLANIPPIYNGNSRKTKAIELQNDEGLGHSTSFIIDFKSKVVIIESTNTGPTIKNLVDFFNRNIGTITLESHLVIDPTQMERFTRMKSFRSLSIKIARMEHGGIFASEKKAISQITKAAEDTNCDVMEIKYAKTQKGFFLNPQVVVNTVTDFLNLNKNNEVIKMEVSGTEGDFSRTTTIDLIQQRLKDYYKITSLKAYSDFNLKNRYANLQVILDQHKDTLRRYYK